MITPRSATPAPSPLAVVPPASERPAASESAAAAPFLQLLQGAQQGAATPMAVAGKLLLATPPHRRAAQPGAEADPLADPAALTQLAQWLAQQIGQQTISAAAAADPVQATVVAGKMSAASVAASEAATALADPLGKGEPKTVASGTQDLLTSLAKRLHALLTPTEANNQPTGGEPSPSPTAHATVLIMPVPVSAKLDPPTAHTTVLSPQVLAEEIASLLGEGSAPTDEQELAAQIAKLLQRLAGQLTANPGSQPAASQPESAWQRLLAEWIQGQTKQEQGVGTRSGETPLATRFPFSPRQHPTQTADPTTASSQNPLLTQETENLSPLGPAPAAHQTGNAHSDEAPRTALLGHRTGRDPALVPPTSTPESRPLSETIQTPLPQQAAQWATETAERIVWHAGVGHQKVELQLIPPHLGKIEVTLQLANDQLTAHFVTASQAARDALDQALPRLRELLQQSGIQLGQSFVASNGSGQGNAFGDSPERSWRGEGGTVGALPHAETAEPTGASQQPRHDGLEAWA